VLRNVGVAVSHGLIAWRSIERGLERVDVDASRLAQDLDANWELLAEPIQTVMRRYGVENAYEQLKALTRGQRINAEALRSFISGLDIPESAREHLLKMTPATYIGAAEALARQI
jgi:adenylosuccinate lyase